MNFVIIFENKVNVVRDDFAKFYLGFDSVCTENIANGLLLNQKLFEILIFAYNI